VYFSAPEQFISSQSAHVSAAVSLAQQTFQYFEELARLNLQTVRTTLAESQQAWQAAFSGKTPVELFALQANAAQAMAIALAQATRPAAPALAWVKSS